MGPTLEPSPTWTCLKHLKSEASWNHPAQMPEMPHLAPVNAKEQQFDSDLMSQLPTLSLRLIEATLQRNLATLTL